MTSADEASAAPRSVAESGFEVALPAGGFRFCDIGAYRSLSGKNLKEIDFGWWDQRWHKLVLLELKGREVWDAARVGEAQASSHLIEVCGQKAIDSLLMLSAAWAGTAACADILAALPSESRVYPGDNKVKLVFLVDVPEGKRELLTPVRDALNAKLKGKLALFGIEAVAVVTLEIAQKMGLPVRRVTVAPPDG
ncbi:hypothetical protein [Sorangium sp. So ce131]|uniref:hypothetical protein n=1 Tax=Sorangium sp. So ce131 TaxID=3133282 RepID=UPI003F5F5B73